MMKSTRVTPPAVQSTSGHRPPAGASRGNASAVGNETKADMQGAQMGQPTDKNPLHGAIKELGAQHPHSYSDHGPHHGTTSHMRHAAAAVGNGKHPYSKG